MRWTTDHDKPGLALPLTKTLRQIVAGNRPETHPFRVIQFWGLVAAPGLHCRELPPLWKTAPIVMVVCVNRNLVTGMPPSVSKAVTNQNDLAAGQLYSFSLFEKIAVDISQSPDVIASGFKERLAGKHISFWLVSALGHNGFAVWNVWESGLCSYQPTPKVDAWQYARITTSPQMFYDRMLCTGIFFIIFAQI